MFGAGTAPLLTGSGNVLNQLWVSSNEELMIACALIGAIRDPSKPIQVQLPLEGCKFRLPEVPVKLTVLLERASLSE